MGILDTIRRTFFEERVSRFTPTTSYPYLPRPLPGDVTNVVTANEALFIPAVWESVTLVAGTLARLKLYVEMPDGAKDYNHPVLQRLVNTDQDQYLVRQTLMANLAMYGQSFASIIDTKLWPLVNGAVTQVRRDRDLNRFFQFANGTQQDMSSIFHIIGSSLDGVTGISPLAAHGLTMKLARAVDEYGQKFFTQRRPVAVLKTQSDLDQESALELARRYHESSTDYGVFVLDRNSELTSLAGTPNEAQFNDTRQSLVMAIARIYKIPPSKLAVMDYSTFNNIIEENISFVRECLMNYAAPFEAAFHFYFGYQIRHDYTQLLEQTFEQRADSTRTLVDSGIITVNEARARLNYSASPDPAHDVLGVPQPNVQEVSPEAPNLEGEETDAREPRS